MGKAAETIGEYTNNVQHNTRINPTESWMMHTIRTIIATTDKVISQHNHKFNNTRDASKFNNGILKRCKYHFTQSLVKERGVMLEPGSEFRDKTHYKYCSLITNAGRNEVHRISRGILPPRGLI